MKTLHTIRVQNKCSECKARANSFFCGLSDETIDKFEALKVTHYYPKKARIFTEGENSTGIFIVCQGIAKLSTCSQDGKVIILGIAQAGEILGLSATISNSPHIVSAETLEPCQISFISNRNFLTFLHENPQASLNALKQMSEHYRSALLHTCSLGLSASAADKVASLILGWCKSTHAQNSPINKNEFHLKISYTHEEIAQMIGSSRETVTRVLKDFSDRGLLIRKGSNLTIPNIKYLESSIGTRMGGIH